MAKSYTTSKTIEYTGALPMTINANGSSLADYRVYGANGGVGDRTEQLFDMSTAILGEGLDINGQIVPSSISNRSDFIKIFPNTTYVRKYNMTDNISRIVHFYDVNKSYIGETSSSLRPNPTLTFTTPNGAEYVLLAFPKNATQVSLIEGSTAPSEYVPYGYAVPISVSDGTTSTTTPIYIGDTPLGEDEYVDYGEGKVYRMSGGVLTPTDPPVPLPALPTVDGTTIVDYDGTPKPSQMYIKYNSWSGWEPCAAKRYHNGAWVDDLENIRHSGAWEQQTAPTLSRQSLSPQMSFDVQPIQPSSQTMGVDEPIALETDVTDNSGGEDI